MTESLRALLSGAIDYAGMFPPAGLTLEQALAKYRQHRAGPESWIVGRFVCPAEKLEALGATYSVERDGMLTAIVPWGDQEKIYEADLPMALTEVGVFPVVGAIDTLEFRWLGNELRSATAQVPLLMERSAIGHASASVPYPVTMFVELPPVETSLSKIDWGRLARDSIRQLASYCVRTKSVDWQAGFKLRCAGTGNVPSAASVAGVICACRDSGVFWKATAGLHHPFRHLDPALGVPVHGFINLLTAAVMADAHRLDVEQVQCILEDDDPWHFRFTNEALTWRELSATVPQIAGARERGLRSFGSCSIEEPWQDLTVLGLL